MDNLFTVTYETSTDGTIEGGRMIETSNVRGYLLVADEGDDGMTTSMQGQHNLLHIAEAMTRMLGDKAEILCALMMGFVNMKKASSMPVDELFASMFAGAVGDTQ